MRRIRLFLLLSILAAALAAGPSIVTGGEDDGGDSAGADGAPCFFCKGSKEMNCPLCSGNGSIRGACSTCKGKGFRKCSGCKGTGRSNCMHCKGASGICPHCKGTGYWECRNCEGAGHGNCSKCAGSGQVRGGAKCPCCNGKEKIGCRFCNGTGIRGESARSIKCPRCYDTGDRLCPYCAGGGKIVRLCAECSGAGKLTCPTCNGGNFKVCIICGGKGQYLRRKRWTLDCPLCTKQGFVRGCLDCFGKPYRCGKCGGIGFKIESCPACSKGVVKCTCGKKGGAIALKPYEFGKCPYCRGAEKPECADCRGTGTSFTPCRKCDGAGKAECPKCDEDGFRICRFCKKRKSNERCPICGFTRKLSCGFCGGTNIALCSTCRGASRQSIVSLKAARAFNAPVDPHAPDAGRRPRVACEFRKCKTCGGTGRGKCPLCGGTNVDPYADAVLAKIAALPAGEQGSVLKTQLGPFEERIRAIAAEKGFEEAARYYQNSCQGRMVPVIGKFVAVKPLPRIMGAAGVIMNRCEVTITSPLFAPGHTTRAFRFNVRSDSFEGYVPGGEISLLVVAGPIEFRPDFATGEIFSIASMHTPGGSAPDGGGGDDGDDDGDPLLD